MSCLGAYKYIHGSANSILVGHIYMFKQSSVTNVDPPKGCYWPLNTHNQLRETTKHYAIIAHEKFIIAHLQVFLNIYAK